MYLKLAQLSQLNEPQNSITLFYDKRDIAREPSIKRGHKKRTTQNTDMLAPGVPNHVNPAKELVAFSWYPVNYMQSAVEK